MTTVQTIAKNTSWLVIADIANKLLLFVLFVFMTRYLGDVGFGKYSFAVTFTMLFAILSDLGMGGLLTREVARDKTSADKYFGNVSLIKTILSLIVYVLIVITINLMNYPSDTRLAVYILGFYVLFDSFTLNFFCPIYRAFEKMEYEALVHVIKNFITVALGLLAIYLDLGFIALISAFLIGSIFGFVVGLSMVIKRFTKPKIEIDFAFWSEFMKKALPFAMGAIFVPIYFNIDKVMLSVMKGDAVVGWYSGATTLVYALLIIPSAFNGSIFPIMSRWYITDKKNSLKVLYEKSFKYLLMLALPIAVGTTILADRIVLLILGEEFVNSIIVLQILVWVLVFMFLNNLIGGVLGAINKQMVGAAFAGVAALLNIILNLLLIPEFGGVGAAVATVATEGVGFIYICHYVSTHMHKISAHRVIVKPLFASLIMGVFLMLPLKDVNLVLIILSATLIYALSILLIKGFIKEDLNLIRQLIGDER